MITGKKVQKYSNKKLEENLVFKEVLKKIKANTTKTKTKINIHNKLIN